MSIELIIGAVVAFLGLFGWGKYQSNLADKYKTKAKESENEAMHEKQRAESANELNEISRHYKEKAKEDEVKIKSNKRPDTFADNSMFDD